MRNNLLLALMCFLFSFVPLVNAAPGDLDPTFGTGGIATDFTNNVVVRKILVQADGKIIIVGSRKIALVIGGTPLDYLFVRRYTSGGTLDTTYPSFKRGVGYDAELQADGKLVVVGEAPNTVTSILGTVDTTSPVVWRFNTNGTTDTSFGSSGSTFVNSTGYGNSHIEVFAGNIFVGYASRSPFLISTPSYRVSRLSPSGTFDFTISLTLTYVTNEKAFSMKVDPLSGDIIVGGSDSVDQNSVLRRYTQNGVAVSSFGTNGVAAVPDCTTPNPELRIKDVVIQPDGKILVHRYTGGGNSYVNISRQASNGSADGLCNVAYLPPFIGQDLFLQPDGKFLFFVGLNASGTRYFPDGTFDASVPNLVGASPGVIQQDQKWLRANSNGGSSFSVERRVLD